MTAFAIRRRRLVLVGAVIVTLFAAALSGNVVEHLSGGGFDAPGSESDRAARTLERRDGVLPPNLVLLVRGDRPVDAPAVAQAGTALAEALAREPGVERVTSYWGTHEPRLRGRSGRSALIEARLGGDEDAQSAAARRIGEHYRGQRGELDVGVAGVAALIAETEDQVEHDLTRAEVIALPLTLLALYLVFGGVLAATLPLAVGIVSIVVTLLALRLVSEFTPVSVFALNLATALGLGLSIDYSLLILARYREELRRGTDPAAAITATMATAGRTVRVSAVIVAVSLAGLLVFPMYYLRSFAYAGVAVVAIAALSALLLVPALVAVFGRRIGAARRGRESGLWDRLARLTMRRPLPLATLGVLALLVLGAPFLRVTLGFVDDRNLPASAPVHRVSDQLRAEFPVSHRGTLFVVAPRGADTDRIKHLPGVLTVESHGTWLAVHTGLEANSPEAERLVRDVRTTPGVEVTGSPAVIVDTKHAMAERLPFAIALIVVATFAALFALTGSLLAPIKALALSALSLTATFGALVFIFQDGNLQWLVGDFTVTHSIAVLTPPLLFCVAFGLSMDYEVFLLSRIKEEHDAGRGDADAIALGLRRTGPVITAAAAVMTIVFVSLATSGVTGVKSLGVGLAIAVVIDATLVRAVLVPTIMRLAGRLNWWAPRLAGARR
jgi:RND superfamily putative drug exporter